MSVISIRCLRNNDHSAQGNNGNESTQTSVIEGGDRRHFDSERLQRVNQMELDFLMKGADRSGRPARTFGSFLLSSHMRGTGDLAPSMIAGYCRLVCSH